MNDLRKAAEMALEAFEMYLQHSTKEMIFNQIATARAEALRQALAQTEKPPVKSYCGGKPNYCTPEVTPEVTTEVTGDVGACVTCGAPKSEWLVDAVNISAERVDETAKREHKPYGYLWFTHQMERRFTHYRPKQEQRIGEVTPIYTAPPKREWVGLTDDDVHDAFNYVEMVKLLDFDRDRPEWCEAFASACEATLRHKNGGNK